jgi:hypothetical protein
MKCSLGRFIEVHPENGGSMILVTLAPRNHMVGIRLMDVWLVVGWIDRHWTENLRRGK